MLQDPLLNVFTYESMEDQNVRYKCIPENFRGRFLRRPFQGLSNLVLEASNLKSASLSICIQGETVLLEMAHALAGEIHFESFTSPSLYFLETEASLFLDCAMTTDDIDQVPDFLGTAHGYRFGMPDESTILAKVQCPEEDLRVSWDGHSIQYTVENDDSDSDVSCLIEEVLYNEHEDSSDLRSILM